MNGKIRLFKNNIINIFSDVTIKQYIKFLSENKEFGENFVKYDLDDTHLFIDEKMYKPLMEKLNEYYNKLSN